MNTPDLTILNGNMHAALLRAHEATSTDLPHDRILRFEEVMEQTLARHEAGEHDRYRALQWVTGVRGCFRYLIADGIEPQVILPRLWSAGQRFHVEGYQLTEHERHLMESEEVPAIRWKLRTLFGTASHRQIELAVAAFIDRTRYDAREDVRFDDLLHAESDGLENRPGVDEMTMRREAVVLILRFLPYGLRADAALAEKALRVMRELWTVGRGMHAEPFRSMTMEEAGLMLNETKANHSIRGIKLSRLIERHGMSGSRLPGQKTKGSRASYRQTAARTCNRRRKPEPPRSPAPPALPVPPKPPRPPRAPVPFSTTNPQANL